MEQVHAVRNYPTAEGCKLLICAATAQPRKYAIKIARYRTMHIILSIYFKCTEKANLYVQKTSWWFLGSKGAGELGREGTDYRLKTVLW